MFNHRHAYLLTTAAQPTYPAKHLVGVGLASFLLALFSTLAFELLSGPGAFAPLAWPASGLAYALVWRYGAAHALWPAAGAALAVVSLGSGVLAPIGVFLAAVTGPGLAALANRRFSSWKPTEHRLDAVTRQLLVAGLVAAPIDALILAFALRGSPLQPPGPYALACAHIWLIDAVSITVIGSAALAWFKDPAFDNERQAAPWRFDAPTFLMSAAVIALHLLFTTHGMPIPGRAMLMLLFPVTVWLAIRSDATTTHYTLLAIYAMVISAAAWNSRGSQIGEPMAYAFQLGAALFALTIVVQLTQAVGSDRRAGFARVARQSREDMSTGLLNDRGLLAGFSDRLAAPARPNLGLIGVHLSNFDSLTDLCGAFQSMQLEQSTAALLVRQPGHALSARLSAGRYTLVVEAETVAQVRAVARELYGQLNGQVFRTDNGSVRLQACVGGLLIDRSALINSEDCMSALADALAIAASVRDPQLFVEPLSQTMIDARRAHQERIEHIREAIRNARLELFAQPLSLLEDTSPNDLLEYEILTRLRDRDGSLIQPPEFLPLAMQAQMTVALDRAVIQRVFAWLADHPQALARTGKCSINLSGRTLSDGSIPSFIRQLRQQYNIPAQKIMFEITESEAIRNPSAASRLVDDLKAEGFDIALDDFGTGLATFEYLKRFPLDSLKIDGSFIRNIATSPIDEEIVLSTIRVARRLSLRTVAEHVHSEPVLARLQELGVDQVQGDFIGRPTPLAELFQISEVPVLTNH